jgi:CRP/FNR family transcriptional regulator, dissimilatory nitrate respiration regulator
VPLARSWTLVAEELGLTREAVYRALAKLERQALIRREPGWVCLHGSAGQLCDK